MLWFTSDTHFGHERIITLSNRPFKDVEEMNETIIERWNEVVGEDDWVFHLGDVALGKIADTLPLVGRLNGTKVLVPGNHDRIFSAEKDKQIEKFWPKYSAVFDHIAPQIARITLGDGRQVVVSHLPFPGFDSQEKDRFSEERPFDLGIPLIHGHTHSTDIFNRTAAGTPMVHVGVDAWDFRPVSQDQIITLLDGTE